MIFNSLKEQQEYTMKKREAEQRAKEASKPAKKPAEKAPKQDD